MRVSPEWKFSEVRVYAEQDLGAKVVRSVTESDYDQNNGTAFLIDETKSTSDWWAVHVGKTHGWAPKSFHNSKTLELDLDEMEVDEAGDAEQDAEAERKFYENLDKHHHLTNYYVSCAGGGEPAKKAKDHTESIARPDRGPHRKRLDLFGMYNAVKAVGGYDAVQAKPPGAWGKIADATDNEFGKRRKGYDVKRRYKFHLRDFEIEETEMADARDEVVVLATKPLEPGRYDDEEKQPEERGRSAFDNNETLQKKLCAETDSIVGEITEFKRNVRKELKGCDSITRPLENNVEEIRRRPWPGSNTVILGENGIGKSFLLDLILRLGKPTQAEYVRLNKDATDEPLEAVRDEVRERDRASSRAAAVPQDYDKLVHRIQKDCVKLPPSGVFKEKIDGSSKWYVLCDEERRSKALKADEQVQTFCQTKDRDVGFESFVLPSRNSGESTTQNSIIIKNGSSWHLKCCYYTKNEIVEKLSGFDWDGNREQQEKDELDKKEMKLFKVSRLQALTLTQIYTITHSVCRFLHFDLNHQFMKDWKQKIQNPVTAEEAAPKYPPTCSDDDSDDSDDENERMAESLLARQAQAAAGMDAFKIHDDYKNVLGETIIYSVPPTTKEIDARIYIKSKLDEVLFGGRETVLKECVLYAPCMLLHEGSCLVDTAGTDDSDALKHHLLVEELERADTVFCVVKKGLPESESTIEWLVRERLIERALGGRLGKGPAALGTNPEGREEKEQDAPTGGGEGASEKPLKLVFLVNHQEPTVNGSKTAAEIAALDGDYDCNSKDTKAHTNTKAQLTAIKNTKVEIMKLIKKADPTLESADIASLSKEFKIFSCNPLLYVSLLTNRSIKSDPKLGEMYQKALARSNGKDLLTALSKCAARNDVSDRVGIGYCIYIYIAMCLVDLSIL
jgi:hypothetical protein